MKVVKRNGKKEKLSLKKIQRTINFASQGVADASPQIILKEIEPQLFDMMHTSEIYQLLIIASAQNIPNDLSYGKIAARLILHQLYKDVLGKDSFNDLKKSHEKHFQRYIKESVARGLLKQELLKKFNISAIAKLLNPENDQLLKFTGIVTLRDRYLLRDNQGNILETPQEFWMRVALGIGYKEKQAEKHAVEFYNHMARLLYMPSTPTLFNAGAKYSQLSSCFLIDIQDDINRIAKALSDSMKLVKYSGGIGAAATKLRASGSSIKTIQGASAGPIPFIKMFDSVIGGINLGGRRRGAMAVFIEPWHLDIERFLALKRTTGDINQRAYFLNTSVFCNDEFLKRVEKNELWYLFDPKEVPELTDHYGRKFSESYQQHIKDAKQGKIKRYKIVSARKLLELIIHAIIDTSNPWLTFKDPANIRCPLKNLGIVHSSNLCTEVYLPTDDRQIAVCNLTSINLVQHIKSRGVDWEKLKQSVRTAIRQLDNIIDVNFYPSPDAEYANKLGRPIGLGVMGLSDFLEKIGLSYASKESIDVFDQIIEFISYHAIDASADLAEEKGRFLRFNGSDWSKGKIPLDTIKDLENERGQEISVNRDVRLDWDALRKKVKRGMRNGTVMAIAPTATISTIAGTSQSIEPNFSNLFARKNIEGKFIEINENLVAELKKLRLWDRVKENIIAKQSNIQDIKEIPIAIKARFRTAYEIDPKIVIEYAARAQKWVDMAISRNLYFSGKDVNKIIDAYLYAWRAGLKSTYYAFFKTSMTLQPQYIYKEQHKVIRETMPVKFGICEACQ